jgi:hypothetical protein
MKPNKTILLPVLASLVLLISIAGKTIDTSIKIKNTKKNNVAGSWNLISCYLDDHGKQLDIFGMHPNGMVIFTEDFHFMVIVNNPDIPKFVSGDRSNGTPEEYKTAVINSLGTYGTYTIDDHGDFLEQHVLGSTFQNMNGIHSGSQITRKVENQRMTENIKITDSITIKLVWQRTQ